MTSGNEMMRAASRSVATRGTALATRTPAARWSRRRGVMGVFAGFAVVMFAAAYIGPMSAVIASADDDGPAAVSLWSESIGDAQSYEANAEAAVEGLGREDIVYSVYVTPTPTPTPTPTATATGRSASATVSWTPPFVAPDPGSAQAIAYDMVMARGWGEDEFACLVSLWHKESGWRVNAHNRSSGAYGIPQSLPGNKMASAGADWETNPATQITWGLGYISGRYGTPCGAWGHSQVRGWY